jgi:hypothetical protein
MYVPGGTGTTSLYNTLELTYSGDVAAIRHSDGKARIKLVTSTHAMSRHVLLHDCTRHTRTPHLTKSMQSIEKLTSAAILAPLLKQSLGLMNVRWLSVHLVDVRVRVCKRVP